MPNQPKTPARTFRLSDETMSKLDDLKTAGDNMSDALRNAIDSMHALGEAMGSGLPEGISIEAMAAAEGVTAESIEAAGDAGWLNARMPTDEANRRLLKALVAAAPHLTAEARRDERQRTIRDIITRLEGHNRSDVSQLAIDTLKSLLD